MPSSQTEGSGCRWRRRLSDSLLVVLLLPSIGRGALAGPAEAGTAAARTPTSERALRSSQPTDWVVHENSLPGTRAWRIPPGTPRTVEGYLDRVSAQAGDEVTLYASTTSGSFHVQAYRLGYYQGLGARLVWRSPDIPGLQQADPVLDGTTNMVEARWSPTTSFVIGPEWVQGSYLLKLVAADGGQSYVPFTVRDDSSLADLVLQNEVTTWQAYNQWGGYSLYHGPAGGARTRSRVVSFDRPYDGERFLRERWLIALVERLGLDVTYWTDIDLHRRPELLTNHRALISPQHDEYWSASMRRGALYARDEGVNIALFGANADFRHVRFERSPLGLDRRMVCYKVAEEDPLFGIQDRKVTSNWRDPPVPRPESVLNGGLFTCFPVHRENQVVRAPGSWVFDGTGLGQGDPLPGLIDRESDRVAAEYPTPESIQILARARIRCGTGIDHAEITYYTTRSGAGVIDVGTLGWDRAFRCTGQAQLCDPRVVRISANILRAFAAGPAGIAHPSHPNLDRFGIVLADPVPA